MEITGFSLAFIEMFFPKFADKTEIWIDSHKSISLEQLNGRSELLKRKLELADRKIFSLILPKILFVVGAFVVGAIIFLPYRLNIDDVVFILTRFIALSVSFIIVLILLPGFIVFTILILEIVLVVMLAIPNLFFRLLNSIHPNDHALGSLGVIIGLLGLIFEFTL